MLLQAGQRACCSGSGQELQLHKVQAVDRLAAGQNAQQQVPVTNHMGSWLQLRHGHVVAAERVQPARQTSDIVGNAGYFLIRGE